MMFTLCIQLKERKRESDLRMMNIQFVGNDHGHASQDPKRDLSQKETT